MSELHRVSNASNKNAKSKESPPEASSSCKKRYVISVSLKMGGGGSVSFEVGDSVIFKEPLEAKCSLPIRSAAPYIGRVEAIWISEMEQLMFRCRWYFKV